MAEITIPGVSVGHATDAAGQTGCTVVVLPPGTTASYEVRGGAPATRELICLEPDKSVTDIDAVLLTGGSVFGLAAADGVVAALAARGRGVGTPAGPVPIVPTLGLFDLGVGDPAARPTAESGRSAVAGAASEFATGRVGAGTGAFAAQWRGPSGRRGGGLGFAERSWGPVTVAALVAVNAFGDLVAPGPGIEVSFECFAAARESFDFDREGPTGATDGSRTHTTIGVVVTNARLDKTGCRIVAQGAHDGLARAITPPHTRFDGDGFVAAATGQVDAPVDVVRLLALTAVCDAIAATAPRPPSGPAASMSR